MIFANVSPTIVQAQETERFVTITLHAGENGYFETQEETETVKALGLRSEAKTDEYEEIIIVINDMGHDAAVGGTRGGSDLAAASARGRRGTRLLPCTQRYR